MRPELTLDPEELELEGPAFSGVICVELLMTSAKVLIWLCYSDCALKDISKLGRTNEIKIKDIKTTLFDFIYTDLFEPKNLFICFLE